MFTKLNKKRNFHHAVQASQQWPLQARPRPHPGHPLLQLRALRPQGQGHQAFQRPQHRGRLLPEGSSRGLRLPAVLNHLFFKLLQLSSFKIKNWFCLKILVAHFIHNIFRVGNRFSKCNKSLRRFWRPKVRFLDLVRQPIESSQRDLRDGEVKIKL